MGPPRAALIAAQLHRHLVQGTPAFRRGRGLRLAVGWRRLGRWGSLAVGGGQGLLHGLQVGLGASGRWCLLRLGGVARCGPLGGAFFAGFDDVLQGGEGGRDAALQFGVVNAA